MSTNPQWNASLFAPKSPASSSLLGFGFNGGSTGNGSTNMLPASGTVNGFNNFPSFGNARSNTSNSSFFPSQTNSNQPAANPFAMNNSQSGNSGGSTSPPMGHFHIGTFNANAMFGDETKNSSSAAHHTIGNGNAHRPGDQGAHSPNNLGSKETGIIEKLLVCTRLQIKTIFRYYLLSICLFIFSIPTDLSNAVSAKPASFFILVNLTVTLNT